jgi:hypothetical protein
MRALSAFAVATLLGCGGLARGAANDAGDEEPVDSGGGALDASGDTTSFDAYVADVGGDYDTQDAPQDTSNSGGCSGPTPNCFGNNLQACCEGPDPYGEATCTNGKWMCGSVAAPGCNGTDCCFANGGTGSATCDQCIQSECRVSWCTCAADSYVNDAGVVAGCLGFAACLYACTEGNPDAGGDAGNITTCTDQCGAGYTSQMVADGTYLVSCAAMLCQTPCVHSGI